MTDAADAIVAALRAHQPPIGGWTPPDLRRLTGLSVGNFAAGVMQLRRDGKLHPYDLALSRRMEPARGETETGARAAEETEASTLGEQVAAEARAAGDNRQAARAIGATSADRVQVSAGAILQEMALNGAPQMAASILRDRWGPTWDRLCRHAQANGQKPVTAMIALLDRALDGAAAAQEAEA